MYLRFLLSLGAAGVLAACGSAGSVPPTNGSAALSAAAPSAQRGADAVVATPQPSGTYWSGTVTGITGTGIVANCGQSNFAQGYGCLPVTTTGAKIGGTPVAGGYFQMWGDLSRLPNITATTINYAASPFPATAPTTAPTPAPTATPKPASGTTPVPAGTYWSGTVSGMTGTGIVANCGQSNFAQGYGCLPVTTTGATIGGTPAAGGYFQMWGDLSHLPSITATTINYAASPFPATAPSAAPGQSAPTAAPAAATPPPTATPAPPVSGMPVNGVEWATSFTPFSAGSVWNTPVSANPTYAANSASVIAAEFNGGNSQPVRDQEAGTYDYGHPIYYASATDPVVNVACNMYCPSSYPKTMYMPAKARPALGSDAHLGVVQPDGTEIDMWATYGTPGGSGQVPQTRNWQAGDTVTAGNVTSCGNFFTGTGIVTVGPAATAGGACLSAGLLRANELASGHINHALFLISQCAVGSQYPAFAAASTDPCTSGSGPPLGGRLWYDVPDATTNANSALAPWEKAILNALHDYGGYLEDDIGGASQVSGIGFLAESGESSYAFGMSDPFAAMTNQKWSAITIPGAFQLRYIGADPWNPSSVNFAAHLHWLNACSAQKSC